MFYNYLHAKPNGEIFYIGKGKGKRAWFFYDRNSHWCRIVNKYGTPTVSVLTKWQEEHSAMTFEKFLIASAKCFGFSLTNKTNGGDGTSGLKRKDLSNYNKTRISPLTGKFGVLSKTSKPLCVEFTNGDVVFTEAGGETFARMNAIPTGTISFCLSTGKSCFKHDIKKVWRP
jgi:hypothetical protein